MTAVVARAASTLIVGQNLHSFGFGDPSQKITKIDRKTQPGFTIVFCSQGTGRPSIKYKFKNTELVSLNQAPMP